MNSSQVAPNVWKITLPTPFAVGAVNTYLIKEETVTLVDCGPNTKEAEATLIAALYELHISINDIEQVILTHHHPDHIGGLGFLPEQVTVIGHSRLEPWLTQNKQFLRRYEAFFTNLGLEMGVPRMVMNHMPSINEYMHYAGKHPLNIKISEGDDMDGILPGWEVIETPGHAESHIGLIRKSDRLYITGDHLLPHISSNALLEPPYEVNEDRPKTFLNYRKSLEKCQKLDVNLILPGHGRQFTNHIQLINERFKRQENRAQDILDSLNVQSLTTFEIGKVLFPKVYLKQLDLVLSEVTGYLDWLEQRGDIISKKNSHQVIFQHAVRLT